MPGKKHEARAGVCVCVCVCVCVHKQHIYNHGIRQKHARLFLVVSES
jgi:hypothetical protein